MPRELRLQVYQSLQERLREIEPGNPQLQSLTSPDYSPSQADIDALTDEVHDAQERVSELPNTAWEKGWAVRGPALEVLRLRGMRILPSNTPTIDDFPYKVAVSIKSIDLNAPWYRNPAIVSYRINRYVDNLSRFNELSWGDFKIKKGDIEGKVLDIVIPIGSGTPEQMRAISEAKERARSLGIHILVNRY